MDNVDATHGLSMKVVMVDYDDDLYEPPDWIAADLARAEAGWAAFQTGSPAPRRHWRPRPTSSWSSR